MNNVALLHILIIIIILTAGFFTVIIDDILSCLLFFSLTAVLIAIEFLFFQAYAAAALQLLISGFMIPAMILIVHGKIKRKLKSRDEKEENK